MSIFDSLRYYWRTSLAVVMAAAVTTAVLGGALIVGDSVRGSLRAMTLERLGEIDQAIVSEQFFRAELADDLASDPAWGEHLGVASPALMFQGSLRQPDNGRRASKVSIQGISESFGDLFPEQKSLLDLSRTEGQAFPSIAINQKLAEELDAVVGDNIVLSLSRPSDIPRDSLMGSTDPSEAIQTLRLTLKTILPDRGVGRFGLSPHQVLPSVGFVALSDLSRALRQGGRVNAIFVSSREPWAQSIEAGDLKAAEAQQGRLEEQTVRELSLGDIGLELDTVGESVVIRSREILLRPELSDAVEAFAAEHRASVLSVSTYLANRAYIEPEVAGAASTPYSTITAINTAPDPRFGGFEMSNGEPAPEIDPGQILINQWAADDLDARQGDTLTLLYYQVGEREELITREASFEVAGVLAMTGLTVDRELTPEFPGVNDADNMADWDPTFPVDLGTIRDKDEDYWDDYRAAPKFFVHETERRLWASRFGEITSIRLVPQSGDEAALATLLEEDLPRRIELADAGIAVHAVKGSGLDASKGATDFSGLFIGFSLFLIVAAALLVALFFRLGVERRAKELGLRLASGTTVRHLRAVFLKEGLLLATVGGLVGLLGAVGYAALMMIALRTLWIGAVGSSFLELHIQPQTLPLGFAISFLVITFAIWRAVRRLAAMPVTGLLKGVTRAPTEVKASKRARVTAVISGVVSLILLVLSTLVEAAQAPMLFFGVGAALLAMGLSLFALWLGRRHAAGTAALESAPGMALANAGMSPGRTLLSVALVASASFVIVAVGSYSLRFGEELREKDSGSGGFPLIAEADVPLYHDLNDEEARFELGFSDADSELLAGSSIVPFRALPGDDVSCLNLYQPTTPRLLGVPNELIERGGFSFTRVAKTATGAGDDEESNPWRLLEQDLGDGVIPAFGDNNSVLWILKSNLGRDVEMKNEAGETIRLRIVGLLRKSIFQSELLISERNMLDNFPNQSGYSTFLIDTPIDTEDEVATALETALERYGFDTQGTAQLLQSFQAVENTYLGTFQTLGGLGLLLGTLGLAVILLRNVLERRSELATLRAIGFRRRRLGWLVVLENSLALGCGVVIGTLAALVAVAPHLAEENASVPWLSLAGTLGLVLAVGTLASIAAVRAALRTPLLPALRAE